MVIELKQAGYTPEQLDKLGKQVEAWPADKRAAFAFDLTLASLKPDATIPQIRNIVEEHLSLNQASVQSEALLVQGGYDIGVATAIEGSRGVGVDAETTQQAAADFARMAAEAVRNGQPLDQVRFNDPNLTVAAQAAIYEQVAQQQGTSSEQIEAKAEAQRQADMQAIQGAVFGVAGVAASTEVNPFAQMLKGVDLSQDLLAMNSGKVSGGSTVPGQQRSSGEGFEIG